MDVTLADIVSKHCRPLLPRPTGVAEHIQKLPDIRAVLFDIYGTLLVSGAGDISLQTNTSSDEAFRDALVECGVARSSVTGVSADLLKQAIAKHHAEARESGTVYPEVDIVDAWRDVLRVLESRPVLGRLDQIDPDRLAAEYEMRINPVWPMPGFPECIDTVRQSGRLAGIVSNAQAMTLELFPALIGRTLSDLEFNEDMQFFSFRCGESKPGTRMFEAAANALRSHGFAPSQAVYIGNDALNDVWAADQVGFRTILYAGDERSLRLRTDDDRMKECAPDAVVTDLHSIGDCLD